MTTDPDVIVVEPVKDEWPEERYSPPPIGLGPHPFMIDEYDVIPVEKFELWGGILFGPTVFTRDAVLLALLANAGLRHVVSLVPRERWLEALGEETM